MLFGKSKRIEQLINLYVEAHNKNVDLHNNNVRQSCAISNIMNLCLSERIYKILDFYDIDNSQYAVCIYDYSCEAGFDINIYDLYCSTLNIICKCEVIFIEDFKKEKVAEISSIQVDGGRRKGHGSRCLQYLEKFLHQNNIKNIYGKIDIHTDIGLYNLFNFYDKNGYLIKNKESCLPKFYKSL